jgi:hypothetical protein
VGVALCECDAGAVFLVALFLFFISLIDLRWLNRYPVEGHSAVNRIANRGNFLYCFALPTQKLGKLVPGSFCDCTTK